MFKKHIVSTHIRIAASRQTVWQILADGSRYSQWNPFLIRMHSPRDGKGLFYFWVRAPGTLPLPFLALCKEWHEGSRWRWRGWLLLPGLFEGLHRLELQDDGAGGCLLIHEEVVWGSTLHRKFIDKSIQLSK